MWKRLVVTVVGVLILGAWGSGLSANEKKIRAAGNPHDLMEAVAKKLDLTDKQKEDLKTVHEKYQPQYQQLFRQELEEMSQVLTPEQREKAKGMFKEWQEKRGNAKKPEEKSSENK